MNATPPAPATACYVYGVVPAGTPAPGDVEGVGDPPSPVTLVGYGRLAAVVSEIDPDRPLGTPRDLRGHARVLDVLAAARTAVLPFRFGSVVRDAAAVADELLAPHEQRFLAALQDLDGLAQFTVRGTYRQDEVLREIVDERADIARLREQIAALPEDAARYRRIQLGELVSQELTVRGQSDTEHLVRSLAPLAAETSHSDASPDEAVRAAFLVRHDRRKEFERVVEDLAAAWSERIELRLLGPLAPYDFASQIVDARGQEPWD
ncbi:GvpL/GvpF family gas vesicle protein [Streptomyces sp. NRRL S-350]|uniref:GvpL/GvpF family gas vesicle protein n=1 Tax=Streptomyces sp. NRRL S-350 TaxID=1463902 RepID=UPI0004C00ED2|nr:GvpL/GvpF family gas vesicle protein [Streptomyces sp. NRRL S-350]